MTGPEIVFYEITAQRIEDILPDLLEKALVRGWQSLVLCDSKDQQAFLDRHLWTYRPDSFLPHGVGGGHPISLIEDLDGHTADLVFFLSLHAGKIPFDFPCTRLCILFDGRLDDNRELCSKTLAHLYTAGLTPVHWGQDKGKWVKYTA